MFAQKKISIYVIKKILQCFCINVDATRTALLVGVNRKTVNHYFWRFRLAIYAQRVQEKRKIIGQAECDAAYCRARRRRGFHGKLKRGRGTLKQPVFGIFERNGEVFTEIVPDCKEPTLQDLIFLGNQTLADVETS